MGTNAVGVRYPEVSNDPDVPRDIKNAVDDLSPKGVQTFSSTTQRNTAYSSVPFKTCVVNDTYYRRVGSLWQEYAGANWGAIDASRTSPDDNAVSGTWKALGMANSPYTEGTGLTVLSTGVLCGFTGRVQASGSFNMTAGAGTNRRGIGIGVNTQTIRDDRAANGGAMTLNVSGEMSVTSGDVLKLWALQTEPSTTLLVSNRLLQVRRVA